MLRILYKIVTPWATANKNQILKNRILGAIANIVYPIYCRIFKISTEENYKNLEVIVSLTSFPARIDKLYLCINSILRQSSPAGKVILWLADSQFDNKESLPTDLLKLEEYGLEIRFCDDLRSYKKVFYTAQEYSDKVIITADDDTLYPEDWIEGLLRTSTEHPNTVCCYRAHKMMIKEGKLLPYKDWIGLSPGEKGPFYDLLPVGVGGVLYPKDYFKGFEFNIDVIRKLCPTTDDLWLKAIGLIKRIPAVKVYANSKEWFTIKSSQNIKLSSINAANQNLNDISMKNLVEYYGIDVESING